MIKRSHSHGFAHGFLITGLSIALICALGFVLWQNFIYEEPTATKAETVTKTQPKDEVVPTEETGTVVGSLTYPSEQIPASIKIHAVNLDTNKEYVTTEHLTGSQYQYGVGYRIEVPVGRYNVYGTLPEQPNMKAYYNQVIVCGVKVECTDTSKVEVTVEANKDTADATVGDWWTQQ